MHYEGVFGNGHLPLRVSQLHNVTQDTAQQEDIDRRLETFVQTAKPDPKNKIVRYLAVTRSGEVLEAAPETPFRKLFEKKFEGQVRMDKIFEIYEKFWKNHVQTLF